MILRKPYAFLIKYFKIVHLVLSLLMIYVVYKISNISNFIADYINNIANTNIATSYIGPILFLVVLLIIGISVALYILMRYKKKPKLLYLINTIVYSVIFFVLFYVLLNFQTIEKELLDPKTIRILRDIVKLVLYPEYAFIIVMIVRTLGFDIKKFDFKSDIEEMNIDVTDNEEIELSVGIDTEKIKTKGRRHLRELKYYVLENKVFVYTILGVVSFIIIISIILNINFINKVYKEGENVKTSFFTMNIVDSYITNKNDVGESMGLNDTSYIIINFNVSGLFNDGYKYKLSPNRFLLVLGGETYTPTLKKYDSFKLLGVGYRNQTLNYNKMDNYILVYNVPNKDIKKSKYIRYEDGFEYVKKSYIAKTSKIKISPENIDDSKLVGSYNLNDTLNFEDSLIDGTLKVITYEIAKKFDYEYKYCVKDYCENMTNAITGNYNEQILKLEVQNNIDKYDNYNFANNFVKVKYKIKEKEYTSDLSNKTPESSVSTIYLGIDDNVTNADSIWLEITIRNKKYKYILK